MILVEIAFCIGLGKYFWDRHKSSMVVGLLSALLVPKTDPGKHSKATRTASNTLLISYTYGSETHELVLPVRKRPLKWTSCVADMGGDVRQDVTELVKPRAGPYGDFFGIKLSAGQICRGASALYFMDAKGDLILSLE
uniref:Uncharacterized protein n=1 Tax=viral metagenome TaxID=1070528 RepID=A0A6C0CGP2_9ZZZZ